MNLGLDVWMAAALTAGAAAVAAPVTDLFPLEDIPITEFPREYEDANRGRYRYEIPEVFELVSVALVLSDWGWEDREGNLFKDTPYAHEVIEHFGSYRSHELIRRMNEIDLSRFQDLVGLRNNSYQWEFDGDALRKIEFIGPWSRSAPAHMDDLKPLLEDFSHVTGFRAFYASHAPFYAAQIAEMHERTALDAMQQWLEREFPISYDAYRLIFSPLIRGQHAMSENFGLRYSEVYTITAGPYFTRTSPNLDGGVALAKMVFTEVDHAYVNISTALHVEQVQDALGGEALGHWRNERARSYGDAIAVMNELTTWAVFLLYVR